MSGKQLLLQIQLILACVKINKVEGENDGIGDF